jgi:hypothetical protein
MKPYVIYKKSTPSEGLWNGGIYRANNNGWMITENFIDWLKNVFHPSALEIIQTYIPN